MKSKIQSILKRNLSAIIFFVIIGFGVFSYIDDRNQKIQQTENLTTFVNGSFGIINQEYKIISSKTFIAEDVPESYDEVVTDINSLINQIDDIYDSIPLEGNNIEKYRETVANLQSYLSATKENLEVLAKRYELEKSILDKKSRYFELKENPQQINSADRFNEFLDLYLEVSELQSWFFEFSDPEDDSLERADKVVDELMGLKNSDLNGVNFNEKAEEIVNKTGFYSYTKLFRISQNSNLEDREYLDSLENVQESLDILRGDFNLD